MNHYKATNTDTGAVDEYDADAARPEHLVPPWFVENVTVVVPTAPAAPASIYGGRRSLSKLEFLRLLTQQERVAIMVVSAGADPTAQVVRDYMYLLEQAGEVNLDDAEIVGGLTLLEQGGLLAAGRAAQILAG